MTDEHTPDADVLEPFLMEWAERARKAQEAIDALTTGARRSRAPRIERRRSGGEDHYVLIRRDGDEARAVYGKDAREVTVWFTPKEWAMVTQVILLLHGLAPAPEVPTEKESK